MMPRPKTKEELLRQGSENFEKILSFLETLSEEELHGTFPFDSRDRNIRDILAHLHHWHLMMMDWHKVGMTGEKPNMPAKGYTWKTTADLNQVIWGKYQETNYEEVVKLLNESFSQLQAIIKSHSDEELFEKKRYKWTGTTSMGSYLVSASSSHYDWAMKLFRKYKKSL